MTLGGTSASPNASPRRPDARAITTAIRRTNFLRRPLPRAAAGSSHREWLHFSLVAPELTLLVNTSVVDDARHAGREHGRVIVLVREGERWDGGCDEVGSEELTVHGGGISASLADTDVEFTDDGLFRVAGRLRDRAVAFDVVLRPLAFPSLASNVALAPGEEAINWVVVPSLRADGWLTVGNRRREIRDVSAYHDHNWGYFTHRDFAWQWGHALPDDRRGCPFSVVFARLLNGAQSESFMQALLLWRDGRQHRVFREDEVDVTSEGLLRKENDILTIPRVGRLLAGGRATDVPKRLRIEARGHGDAVSATFEATDVARIVVPNQHDLGTTLIHEVVGRIDVRGHVRGEPLGIRGEAVFEFLGRGA